MKKYLQISLFIIFSFTASMGFARDYIIYSIAQDIPMGLENEEVKKNYYINMGDKQGLDKGTILDVFRVISRLDPYETKKRYNYRVKVGELVILHTEENSAIANLNDLESPESKVYYEVPGMMIGDHVEVKVD